MSRSPAGEFPSRRVQPGWNARYHPYFCEENIWWLFHHPNLEALERRVVFITHPDSTCALWSQQLSPPGHPVVWDYHVVLATSEPNRDWLIWDFDSRLPTPSPGALWFEASIRVEPPLLSPCFRVCASQDLVDFASDRRHMRGSDGSWHAEPPPWPCIGGGARHTLDRFIGLSEPQAPKSNGPGFGDAVAGCILDAHDFQAWLTGGAASLAAAD